MDRQKSGVGSGLRQIVSCTIFSRKGKQFVRRTRQIGACTKTHKIACCSRVLKQIAKKKTAQTLCASRRLYSRRGIKTRELQHELLGQGEESS